MGCISLANRFAIQTKKLINRTLFDDIVVAVLKCNVGDCNVPRDCCVPPFVVV